MVVEDQRAITWLLYLASAGELPVVLPGPSQRGSGILITRGMPTRLVDDGGAFTNRDEWEAKVA